MLVTTAGRGGDHRAPTTSRSNNVVSTPTLASAAGAIGCKSTGIRWLAVVEGHSRTVAAPSCLSSNRGLAMLSTSRHGVRRLRPALAAGFANSAPDATQASSL